MRDDDERHAAAVERELELRCEPRRIARSADVVALLIGRDLGQVERVAHVDAVAREVDGREVIDGEVPERVRGGVPGGEQRRNGAHEHEQSGQRTPHESAFRATGAQRTEKPGLSASAFRYQARMPSTSPEQPAA